MQSGNQNFRFTLVTSHSDQDFEFLKLNGGYRGLSRLPQPTIYAQINSSSP
jgi:hypothetical protein